VSLILLPGSSDFSPSEIKKLITQTSEKSGKWDGLSIQTNKTCHLSTIQMTLAGWTRYDEVVFTSTINADWKKTFKTAQDDPSNPNTLSFLFDSYTLVPGDTIQISWTPVYDGTVTGIKVVASSGIVADLI
jgi:hypothetical protein